MATFTGVSIVGYQELAPVAELIQRIYSIDIGVSPSPPAIAVGWLWVFLYQPVAPFQSFVVDQARLYQPGNYRLIVAPTPAGTWRYYFQANWNRAGISWSLVTQ